MAVPTAGHRNGSVCSLCHCLGWGPGHSGLLHKNTEDTAPQPLAGRPQNNRLVP